jgi:cyclophilin family peptidyl-prolyl cis-trans isomerase
LRRPIALLAALVVLPACGGSKQAQTTTTAPATPAAPAGCTVASPPAPAERHRSKPKQALDPAKTYRVTLKTNCGTFVIRLAVKTSPRTTASFVSLVRSRFFDGTVFHRIVPGFVIQGGDPTATGGGGPGYTTVDRPPAGTRYLFGTVAMAKAANEAPGTSGSQFFVVTAADAGLPPDYAVLGKVVAGAPVVRRIGKLGDVSEQPTAVVEIEHASVSGG